MLTGAQQSVLDWRHYLLWQPVPSSPPGTQPDHAPEPSGTRSGLWSRPALTVQATKGFDHHQPHSHGHVWGSTAQSTQEALGILGSLLSKTPKVDNHPYPSKPPEARVSPFVSAGCCTHCVGWQHQQHENDGGCDTCAVQQLHCALGSSAHPIQPSRRPQDSGAAPMPPQVRTLSLGDVTHRGPTASH